MKSLLRTSSSSNAGSDSSYNIGSSTSPSSRSSTSTGNSSPLSVKTTISPSFRRSGIRKQRLSRIRGGNRDRSGTTWIDDSDSDDSLSPLYTPSGAPCRFEIRRGKVVPQLSNTDVALPSEQDDDIATPLPRLPAGRLSKRFSQQQWSQGRHSGWRPTSSIYAKSDEEYTSDSSDEHSPRGLISSDMYTLSEAEMSPLSSPDSTTLKHEPIRMMGTECRIDDEATFSGSDSDDQEALLKDVSREQVPHEEVSHQQEPHQVNQGRRQVEQDGFESEADATRRRRVAQRRARRVKSEAPRMPGGPLLEERPLPAIPPLPDFVLADAAALKKSSVPGPPKLPAIDVAWRKHDSIQLPAKRTKAKSKHEDKKEKGASPLTMSSAALSPTRRATIVPAPSIVQRMRLAGRSKPVNSSARFTMGAPGLVHERSSETDAGAIRTRPATSMVRPHISETAKSGSKTAAASTKAQKHATLALAQVGVGASQAPINREAPFNRDAAPFDRHARARSYAANASISPPNLPPNLPPSLPHSPPPPMQPLPAAALHLLPPSNLPPSGNPLPSQSLNHLSDNHHQHHTSNTLATKGPKVLRKKTPSHIDTAIAASKTRHSRFETRSSKQPKQPKHTSAYYTRRSIATPQSGVGAPARSVPNDCPPVPPLPPQSIFSMDLKRHTMAQQSKAMANKASTHPVPHYARHRQTPTQSSVDSNFSDACSSILSVSKPLPLAPPELSSFKDPIAQLDVKMQVLTHRRINLTRSIQQMTELMPSDSLLANDDVVRRREAEKAKVEAFKQELAEVRRQEYDLGMKAHRARKRLERDSDFEQPTLWVRKVTG